MKRTNRKGFTTVELVIVIAVIAILAAVLIPTFVSLVNKANQSADIQGARQMDTALQTGSVPTKPATLKEAVEILDDADFNVNSLTPITKDCTFYWCETHNVIILADKDNKVLYPSTKDVVNNFAAHLAANKAHNLSTGASYINVEASTNEEAEAALAAGSDLSLKDDVAISTTVQVKNDMTLDLNGNDLDASTNGSRPFNMSNGGTLTINAEGSTIKCGKYGLVNIESGDANIVINGGTIEANLDWGSFIKPRGNGNVKITLNNVTYVDTSADSLILDCSAFSGKLEVEVNGGSYKAALGFCVEDAKFNGVTIETAGVAIEVGGNAEITNCTIKTGNAVLNNLNPAAVAVCEGGTATVSKCNINTTAVAFYVYNSGGTITANNNTVTAAALTDIDKTGCVIRIDGVEYK